MSTIHPHWLATDDDGDAIPVRGAEEQSDHNILAPSVQFTSISRKPAAIAGILLVLGIGFFFIHGVNDLTGQLTANDEIHITANGFNPRSITVAAGKQVIWINDHSEPISIRSDELCSTLIGCLNTPVMKKDERASFIITDDIQPGSYAYASAEDDDLTGTITVTGDAATGDENVEPAITTTDDQEGEPEPTTSTSPSEASMDQESRTTDAAPANDTDAALLEAIQKQLELDAKVTRTPATSAGGTVNDTVNGIPTNPYTVGSPPIRSEQSAEAPAPASKTPAIAKHKPARQPATGSEGMWGVLLLSLGTLLCVTKKSLFGFQENAQR